VSDTATYDYVIVGAGSAGCVLANRLSADSGATVLLLEAGGPDRNPLFRLPMLMGKMFHSGIYNWHYHTEPEPHLNDRSLYWPRGKALGGSSTINGMLYVRGNRHDYDRWAQLGNSGWSYDDVLPAFRRSEGHLHRDDAWHNREGELTVTRARSDNPLHDVFARAGAEAGHPVNDDFNGEDQEGFGRYDFTIRDGKRWSTSYAFLRPALTRPNLTVTTNALTERVEVDNGRVTGLTYRRNGESHTVNARREVILSAGVVNTPQVLMLSGIGPADELARHGIGMVHELPGVGKNLQDHVDCVMSWSCTQPITLIRDLRVDKVAVSLATGLLFGTGVLTTFPYESGAFMKSREDLAAPDIQLHFMPALEKTANLQWPNPFRSAEDKRSDHGLTIRVGPVNPASRGEILLASADPSAPPKIHANYLSDAFDIATLIAGIRMTREVMAQPAFKPYVGAELAPGPKADDDEALTTWLRETAMTTFHPVGTCKMGHDRMAVVDNRLRVRGLAGLRIADASIMPVITSGNTNAPAIMIGERAADFFREENRG